MTFRFMADVTSLAGSVLGLRFLCAGASVLQEWGMEATAGALVISRRLGALYLGLALVVFLGRQAAPSDLRAAVCLGIGGASALLAGLGVFEFWAGRVGPRIFAAVVAELVLTAGFGWAWWAGR